MIRKFTLLCKLFFFNKSDLAIFNQIPAAVKLKNEDCPHCGTVSSCSFHAFYSRHLILLESGNICCHRISISRVKCSSCNNTHALLPDSLIPYGSYGLSFVISVLKDHFCNVHGSWEALCFFYQISKSTLSRWVNLFYSQKKLWLGVLDHASRSSVSFLNDLFDMPFFTKQFFEKFSISFLQNYRFTAASHHS